MQAIENMQAKEYSQVIKYLYKIYYLLGGRVVGNIIFLDNSLIVGNRALQIKYFQVNN